MLNSQPRNRFLTTSAYFPEYLRRVIFFTQMDVEYTLWQMLYLCVDPWRVYRTTAYHKQTKNQWARDDPAFVVILVYFLAVSSCAFGVAFHGQLWNTLKLVLSSIFIDFLLCGFLIATGCWFLANKYLRIHHAVHSVEQEVEWLYAFDVHCNAFFPFFVCIYVLQYFFLPVLMHENIFATFLANSVYCFAFGVYFYLTFLGYNTLPFLKRTVVFLYPIALVLIVYVFFMITQWNASRVFVNYWFA